MRLVIVCVEEPKESVTFRVTSYFPGLMYVTIGFSNVELLGFPPGKVQI